MTREMTIHAALGELKKIEKKINKAINTDIEVIGYKKMSAENVINTGLAVEAFNERAKAGYQSVIDLIANYKAIKSAIVLSNATTKLIVGKEEMTVAEAIERKNSIEFDKMLLNLLKNERMGVIAKVTKQNERVEEQLDNQIALLTANSKDKTSSLEKLAGYATEYRNQNAYTIVNPLNVEDKITELEEKILDFETNVDVALSNSNALTKITI